MVRNYLSIDYILGINKKTESIEKGFSDCLILMYPHYENVQKQLKYLLIYIIT